MCEFPHKNQQVFQSLIDVCRFETMGVPGLYIGVQAVLALYASFVAAEKGGGVSLATGTFYASQRHRSALSSHMLLTLCSDSTLKCRVRQVKLQW